VGNIVGIDLGTTFSAIATLDDTGRPIIVENADGANITASAVEFTGPDTFVVGLEATNNIGQSEYVAHEVKRSMGLSDVTYDFFGTTHTPTSISALILKKIKEDTENIIGPIESAVVTVPANFANEAREATQAAAELAGLNVTFVINEPTAAALAYAFQSGNELHGTYVIYDLGGGTFDCSIVKINGQDIDILTSEGVAKLGGKDFDQAILKLVREKFKQASGQDLDPLDYGITDAEKVKITLSKRDKANIRVMQEPLAISRSEFEEAISNLLLQAEMAVETAMLRAELRPEDINEVILVGGSTRVPSVQESVKKMFGKEAQMFGNPDESVALGAAVYAAYKSDEKNLNPLQKQAISKISLAECASHFFGTISLSASASGGRELQNSVIIPKDEKIPCSITRSFYTTHDNQTAVDCQVTQSQVKEEDPQFVSIVSRSSLELEAGRPAGQEIKITYSYTEDQKMRCSFLDVGSGNSQTVDLTLKGNEQNSTPTVDINKFKVE
jgi:molecular chaperone DnaK